MDVSLLSRDPDEAGLIMFLPGRSHPLARELRMRLVSFGFCMLQGSKLETGFEFNLRSSLYEAAFAWLGLPAG